MDMAGKVEIVNEFFRLGKIYELGVGRAQAEAPARSYAIDQCS